LSSLNTLKINLSAKFIINCKFVLLLTILIENLLNNLIEFKIIFSLYLKRLKIDTYKILFSFSRTLLLLDFNNSL
jgi:hypothetical protein